MTGGGSNLGLPRELQAVRGKVLEDYVRSRILDFALEPSFAKRLYASPQRVFAAAKEALTELSRPNEFSTGQGLRLVFRHTCLRCASTFAPKYLSGDALKAKCGASIYVEVLNSRGQPVGQDAVKGLHLEICILEGKAYSEADPESLTDEFLDANTLLTDSKGKEVLGPGRDCERTEDKKVVARFINGKAELSVNILGSSIAMLTGQKPPFRLLVRAIASESRKRASGVSWAVSDAFVVATQRVKGAQKAEIPHVEEHVSKIENVGVQTQHKLQDIKAAAQTAGITGINVVHNCVQSVGQFKDLVESTEKDMPLQETLRKVLNFTSKGWDAAKAHAMKAVETDNRMRIWLSDDSHKNGLLFRCNLGRVDLDAPIGILRPGTGNQSHGNGQVELEAIHIQHPSYDRQAAEWLQKTAVECWWRPGHPGWSIWPADSEQFIRGVVEARPTSTTPVQILADAPSTPHSSFTLNASSVKEEQMARAGSEFTCRTGSDFAASLREKSISLAGGSMHQDSASLDDMAKGNAQASNREQGWAAMPHVNQIGSQLQPDSGRGTQTSESGPSGSSLNNLKAQSTLGSPHQPAPNPQGVSWPFNIPLVNAQPMGKKAHHLPASPFDLPMSTLSSNNPVSSTSSAIGFSFRPPPSINKQGIPAVPSQGAGLDRLSILNSFTTQDFDQLIEFQRRLNSGLSANDSSNQSPLQFLSNLSSDYQLQGDATNFPQFISRLSGLIQDPNFASMLDSRANLQGQPPALFDAFNPSQARQGGEQQMPLKISGKVSGILDDLSDAMSLLHELLPSTASEQNLKAIDTEASPKWPSAFSNNSLALFNLPSGLAPIESSQMPLQSSGEGSNNQPRQALGSSVSPHSGLDSLQPASKRKRLSPQEA